MFSLGVAALAALGTTGCGVAVEGVHDTTVHLAVLPAPGGFNLWNNITFDGDISSVGTTNLWGVTLQVEQPSTVTDMSFLSTVTGQAVTPTATTTVVTQSSFPRNEPVVSLNVEYLGDLHPLFESPNEIHIVWTGSTNPDFTAWPADGQGIMVQGDIRINVQ